MPTIYERINHYRINNVVPVLDRKQMVELGQNIGTCYYNSDIKIPLHRVNQKEGKNTYQVLYYPPEYTPEIDRQIKAYYSKIPPRKRHRIPIQKPVYSSVNYKKNAETNK